MPGKIVLLDGYSLMYRAFHALQTPMSAPDGTPTNAVHGFMMMLLKVIAEEQPEGMAVALDVHAPTRRALRYEAYKATRKPMPDELRAQDPVIRELIARMGIPTLCCEGYEADDILGTVSAACEREGREAVLVTGDRDSFQLAGERTTILYTKRGITDTVRVTPAYIRETYGLSPAQLIDVKGLMGDASDNIPGVPGIGEKTAVRLVQQYGSLQAALDRGPAEQKGKLGERLAEHRDLAELSYELATIDRAAPVAFDFDAMKLGGLGGGLPRLRELGMNAAARRLAEVAAQFAPASLPEEAPPVPAAGGRDDGGRGAAGGALCGAGEKGEMGRGVLRRGLHRGDGRGAAARRAGRRFAVARRDRGRRGARGAAAARGGLRKGAVRCQVAARGAGRTARRGHGRDAGGVCAQSAAALVRGAGAVRGGGRRRLRAAPGVGDPRACGKAGGAAARDGAGAHLPRHRAAAGARAARHGARGLPRRRRGAGRAGDRVPRADCRADRRDRADGGRAHQPQFPQAAGRDAVRAHEAARAAQEPPRLFDRQGGARTPGGGLSHLREDPRVPQVPEAGIDVHPLAARPARRGRSRAHAL